METAESLRGRRAEAAVNDQRLLDAARDVFATQGYDAPVAAVAVAAGIGMGSLYRRYATKDDLLADVCLRSMRQMADLAGRAAASGGTAIGRLESFVRSCVAVRCGAFAGVAGRIPVSDEMVAAAAESQQRAGRLVTAAHRECGLRSDAGVVDVLRLIELFARVPGRAGDPVDALVRERLLAIALAGLRSDAPSPPGAEPARLPGRMPTLAEYRRRWA
jgi:AcrR family transcriptional regulator